MMDNISKDNIYLFCAKSYDNKACTSIKEFKSDLKRIKYIKLHIDKYKRTNILNERNILNHMICFFNVFNVNNGVKILFFYFGPEDYGFLVPFLVYLGYVEPNDIIYGINGESISLNGIGNKFIESRLNSL